MTRKATKPDTIKKVGTSKAGWQDRFIAALADYGNVGRACRFAGISRDVAYDNRKTDAEFAKRWKQALKTATDTLEEEAWRRAREGTEKPVYQNGLLIGGIQEYSDTLMIFLLKAHKPKKYVQRIAQEITGKNGAPLTTLNANVDLSDVSDVALNQMITKLAAATIMPTQLTQTDESNTPDSAPTGG